MHLLSAFVLTVTLLNVECYKILGVFPMVMHSHYKLGSTLFKELAARGHEVTVINCYPQVKPIKNYRDISVADIIGPVTEHKNKLYSLEKALEINVARFMSNMALTMTSKTLENKNVQELLHSNAAFDVVIAQNYMNEAHMALALHYNCPLILMATMPVFTWTNFFLANPAPPSYVPNLLGVHSSEMSFWERFANSFNDVLTIAYHQLVILPQQKELARKYIPSHPNLDEILYNVSLMMINAHESIYDAVPELPNIVNIGGLHVHPPPTPDNLAVDLHRWLNESTNGVVVFCMGGNLKSADFPPEKVQSILRVFSRMKENFLWKWENDDLPNKPKNLRIMKWLPLNDVLAHRNVRAFISHGGLLSTIESVYHGIPILGMPVFADQKMNIKTAEKKGYGIKLYLDDLTEEKFESSLRQLLENSSYKQTAEARSRILRDQIVKPIDLGVHWVEYVIRHKGAPHLRHKGLKLYWYQRYLLDVIAVFVLIFVIVLTVLIWIVRKAVSALTFGIFIKGKGSKND